jgi:uncharacterized repeat protein (TIGR01451 family)
MKNVFTLILVLSTSSAFALNSSDFTIQLISAPYFVVDGNSPTTGPQSAYVGFEIKNTSGSTTYSNLKFTITSIGTSVVGQNYTLVSPASGITLVGTLAPGETKVCYYYVSYPANVTPQATFNYSLADATASSKMGNFIIANRSSISANAGGLATQSITSQDLIGGIVSDDVTYTLGNTKTNDENDFQVSISTNFDPTKLVLIKTQVVSSTIPGVTAGTTDSLYFKSTANTSSGTVTIRFTFKISAYNFTSYVLPYAGATSGSTNYKYAISTDLASGTPITISALANPLLISKTSDKTLYGVSTTALFTVTIQNPGAYNISVDKITDQIPAGFSYQGINVASGVTTSNSTSFPSVGATGTVTFEGGVVSGSNTSYIVPAGGSLVLKYTATAPSYNASNLTTTTAGFIGTTQFGSAQNTVNVSSTLPVSIQSFSGDFVNDKVKLEWSTSSETNSSSFEIQRSVNGVDFSKIAIENASNNSSVTKNYSFIDSLPVTGINYYRLKLIDANGEFKYSNIISMKQSKNASSIEIFGNPFHNKLQIKIVAIDKQDVQIKLFDSRGVFVAKEICHCNGGTNAAELSGLSRLLKGTYFLQADVDGRAISKQVVKN